MFCHTSEKSAAAVFGALALCLLIIIQLPDWRLLNTVLVHVVINTLMVKFGCKNQRLEKDIARLAALIYLASFLTGGLLTRLQTHLTKIWFLDFLLLCGRELSGSLPRASWYTRD